MSTLRDLKAGIYLHYKDKHYQVLGYAHDANAEGRNLVVYFPLELDDAHFGPRMAVRDVEDFFAVVCGHPKCHEYGKRTIAITRENHDITHLVPRFQYLKPAW